MERRFILCIGIAVALGLGVVMMLQMSSWKNYEPLAVGECATPTAMQYWEYQMPMQYWRE